MIDTQPSRSSFLNSLTQWDGTNRFDPCRIAKLMAYFGNPQDQIPSIHVAGTNGKGSVSVACAGLLGSTGESVLLTTSPHLSELNERIVIDGHPLSFEEIDRLSDQVRSACKVLRCTLTFHEALTAIAFLAAKEADVSWMVVEVGLGGRLDSTNVISNPEAVIITSIGLDHCNVLGNSLAEIAAEKAGIIKAFSRVTLGSIPDEASAVITNIARERGANVRSLGKDFHLSREEDFYRFKSETVNARFKPSLQGDYQAANWALAIDVLYSLGVKLNFSPAGPDSETAYLEDTDIFWPGRLEKVERGGREFYLDCAHNPPGMELLIKFLEQSHISPKLIVFGALQTKDWQSMLAMLVRFDCQWLIIEPNSVQAVPAIQIKNELEALGCDKILSDFSDQELLRHLDQQTASPVLFAGSMYMIGKIRPLLELPNRRLWSRQEIV